MRGRSEEKLCPMKMKCVIDQVLNCLSLNCEYGWGTVENSNCVLNMQPARLLSEREGYFGECMLCQCVCSKYVDEVRIKKKKKKCRWKLDILFRCSSISFLNISAAAWRVSTVQ